MDTQGNSPLQPYVSGNSNQQWAFVDGLIQNQATEMVLSATVPLGTSETVIGVPKPDTSTNNVLWQIGQTCLPDTPVGIYTYLGVGQTGYGQNIDNNNAFAGESSDAIVRCMGRKDHTAVSRSEMLQSIEVTRNHNREVGKAVANWTDDPNEQTSVHANVTLQSMGKNVVLDNQQSLCRIAADSSRTPNVRAAAKKALIAAQ